MDKIFLKETLFPDNIVEGFEYIIKDQHEAMEFNILWQRILDFLSL